VLSKATLGKPVKPPPEPPEPPEPADPAISYLALEGGDLWLNVMDADGTNPQHVLSEYYPFKTWSPDGAKLAITHSVQSLRDTISTINVDGSGMELVCGGLEHLRGVAWSPAAVPERGYRIAYSNINGGSALGLDIWLISPGGGEAENVTNTPDVYEDYPTWSYDATRLAYWAAFDDGNGGDIKDIWVYDFSTATASRVELGGPFVNRDISIGGLDWARTQDKIAFSAVTSEAVGDTIRNGYEIWVVDLNDPANPVQLTDDPSVPFASPSWSPDDSEIVYQKGDIIVGTYCEIWKMNADGSGKTLLLKPEKKVKSVRSPDWKR